MIFLGRYDTSEVAGVWLLKVKTFSDALFLIEASAPTTPAFTINVLSFFLVTTDQFLSGLILFSHEGSYD